MPHKGTISRTADVNSNSSDTSPFEQAETQSVRIPVRSISNPEMISNVETPIAEPLPEPEKPVAEPETPVAEAETPVAEPVVIASVQEPICVEIISEPVSVTPVIEVVPVPEKVGSPFEEKLRQLGEMGFSNKIHNIELLVQYKGDMLQVVKSLLE